MSYHLVTVQVYLEGGGACSDTQTCSDRCQGKKPDFSIFLERKEISSAFSFDRRGGGVPVLCTNRLNSLKLI